MLRIDHLTVIAPNGSRVLDRVDLSLEAGRAVVLTGSSGAGKSTFLRAIMDSESMRSEGYRVTYDTLEGVDLVGLVPQRGAPFDHVDVAGNLRLALRHFRLTSEELKRSVRAWLERVELDPAWASEAKPVEKLSGGQAQRLAVARVLASGRSVIVMDEPSAGLDPDRVAALAAQIRAACDAGAAVLVVTHDPAFAADFADEMLVIRDGQFQRFDLGTHPQATRRTADDRRNLEALMRHWWSGTELPPRDDSRGRHSTKSSSSGRARPGLLDLLSPFAVLTEAVAGAANELRSHPRDFAHVGVHVLRQTLLRPIAFYAVVSMLLGFTILYVITSFGGDLGPAAAVTIVGGMPALALAPPVSAFLFVAASSNTTNAWLGTMRLSGQVSALEALGIRRRTYLWGPSFSAIAVSYVVVATLFLLGLLVGGWGLCALQGVPNGWLTLTRELIDPTPDRAPYVTRALFLTMTYAVGISADAIAKADRTKESTDSVTAAMTSSVVASTLWVVTLELLTLFVIRSTRGYS